MLEDFYIKKINLPIQSGVKLRKIRLRRNKTVKEVSSACNVTEASIRYYENGDRQLTDERMKEVAAYLQVDESALQDHQLNSVSDILHLLFDLEDAKMLIPVYVPEWDIYTVRITNSLLRDAIKEWAQNSKSVALGEVDQEAYDRWRELYPSEPFKPTPVNEGELPFGNEIWFENCERITDYAYYALVTVLKIRQILTKNTDELEAFIEMYGDHKVQMQYRCLMNNALGFIDYELGRMVEQAKVTSHEDNSNSANSNSETA